MKVVEISETLKRLAAEYGCATTQAERDRLTREIASVSCKEERDRERGRRNAKKRDHLKDVVYINVDFEAAEFREDSPTWLSDRGAGVDSVIAHLDGEDGESSRNKLLRKARDHVRNTAPRLLEVFNLIIKNGRNREESIWALMKSRSCRSGR